MNIAIVSGHFMPELGYQEVYLARAYKRLGHRVRVFTSCQVSPTGKKVIKHDYKRGLFKDPKYEYEVFRLKANLSFMSKVYSFGLKKALLDFEPELIIIIALAKMFASPLLTKEIARKSDMIVIFGDAYEYKDITNLYRKCLTSTKEFIFYFFKKRLYKKAVKLSKRIVLNVPESEKIILSYLNDRDKLNFFNKRIHMNLGFDPDEFYFAKHDRELIRENLNIADDEIVIITSTRVNSRKRLEEIISTVSKMYLEGKKVRYIIIGFQGDNYERSLKEYINRQPNPQIFHCYPILNHEVVRKYYCAADIGVWLKAAISIQEAMGTGLPVILENRPSLNHLVEEGVNGWYFRENDMNNVLKKAKRDLFSVKYKNKNEFRQKTAQINSRKFSYNKIAEQIVSNL